MEKIKKTDIGLGAFFMIAEKKSTSSKKKHGGYRKMYEKIKRNTETLLVLRFDATLN